MNSKILTIRPFPLLMPFNFTNFSNFLSSHACILFSQQDLEKVTIRLPAASRRLLRKHPGAERRVLDVYLETIPRFTKVLQSGYGLAINKLPFVWSAIFTLSTNRESSRQPFRLPEISVRHCGVIDSSILMSLFRPIPFTPI